METHDRARSPHCEPAATISGERANAEPVQYRIREPRNPLQEDPDEEEDIVYRITPGSDVTTTQLETCSKHFSHYYGVWSKTAWRTMGVWARPGFKIRMSPNRLRTQCLPEGASNVLITTVTKSGRQVGHCFVSQWPHGNDRVWWITQLLVLPSYRNQRRATKMLQALTMHCDIGRIEDQTDFVGVASSQPYAICAMLRVFAHGIESLPSKLDWDANGSPHLPLPISRCADLIEDAPVGYVREGVPSAKALTIDTTFLADHTVSDLALQRIIFSMNKQIERPWMWLFGELAPGHEYLCILEYHQDPDYQLQRQFCRKREDPDGEVLLENHPGKSFTRATRASTNRSEATNKLSGPVNYADVDQYLLTFPNQVLGNFTFLYRTRMSMAERAGEKRIREARGLLKKYGRMLELAMDAKHIPESLRPVYTNDQHSFLGYQSSWKELKDQTCMASDDDDDATERRLLILQAVHFKELLDAHTRPQVNVGRTTAYTGRPETPKSISSMIRATNDLARSTVSELVTTLSPTPASLKLDSASRPQSTPRRTSTRWYGTVRPQGAVTSLQQRQPKPSPRIEPCTPRGLLYQTKLKQLPAPVRWSGSTLRDQSPRIEVQPQGKCQKESPGLHQSTSGRSARSSSRIPRLFFPKPSPV